MKTIVSLDELREILLADPESYLTRQREEVTKRLKEQFPDEPVDATVDKGLKVIAAFYLIWQNGHALQMPGYFVKRYLPGGQYVFRADFAACSIIDSQMVMIRDIPVLLIPIDEPTNTIPYMYLAELEHADEIVEYMTTYTERKHKLWPFEMTKELTDYKRIKVIPNEAERD